MDISLSKSSALAKGNHPSFSSGAFTSAPYFTNMRAISTCCSSTAMLNGEHVSGAARFTSSPEASAWTLCTSSAIIALINWRTRSSLLEVSIVIRNNLCRFWGTSRGTQISQGDTLPGKDPNPDDDCHALTGQLNSLAPFGEPVQPFAMCLVYHRYFLRIRTTISNLLNAQPDLLR